MTSRHVSIITLALLGVAILFLAGLPLDLARSGSALRQPEPQRTRTLYAFFTSTDSAGVITDVNISATYGPAVAEATIEVSRYRPTCANNGCPEVLSHSFNRIPLSSADLRVIGALDSATLRTTREVRQRLTPASDTVSFDLNWKAMGRLVQDHHEEGDSFRRARASGAIRAGNTNLTPNPSVEASLEEW